MDIFITFNPTAGRTFDGFGGTLTTAIACLNKGRPCVVVEKDPHCFNLAVIRLYNICRTLYGDGILDDSTTQRRLDEAELGPDRHGVHAHDDNSDSGDEYPDEDIDDGSDEATDMTGKDKGRDTPALRDELEDNGSTDYVEKATPSKATTSVRSSGHDDTRSHASLKSHATRPSIGTDSSQRTGSITEQTVSSHPTVRDCRFHVTATQHANVELHNSDGGTVGTARLATERLQDTTAPVDVLRETIHGHELEDISRENGPHIIVTKVNVRDDCKAEHFEGVHVGLDDEPGTLRKLTQYDFYVWPLSQIVLKH